MWFGFNAYFPGPASMWQVPHIYGATRYNTNENATWNQEVINQLTFRGGATLLCSQYRPDMSIRTLDQFKANVLQAANQFKNHGGVHAIELLNEPNHAAFGKFSPEKAVEWATVGHLAVKSTGWNKPILINGPARIAGWEDYLKKMAAINIPVSATWSCHPYPQPPEAEDPRVSVGKQIRYWRRTTGRRALWVTELGVPVANGVSEDQQRNRLEGLYRLCAERGIKGLQIFRFQDGADVTAGSVYECMGVVRTNQSFRPAYHRLKTISGNA